MKIEGARALVTGGSAGIGKGIAKALAAEGARVLIAARGREDLERTARELGCEWVQADVSQEADAVRAVATCVERFGGIDLLVNNAGIGRFQKLVESDLEAFEEVLRVNVIGPMLMAREAAKHFVAQRSGHLVNIGSTSGLKGGAGAGAYSASKFALRGLSECWRDELRRSNVRVMQVNPSEVVTHFGRGARGAEPEAPPNKLRPQEIADAIVGALKLDDRGFVPELAVFATNPF